MVVRVRFELGDVELRALAARIGERGCAKHQDVEAWIESLVSTTLQVIVSEHEAECEGQPR